MTRQWKLKTNSCGVLLVLITFILIKTEWAKGQTDISSNLIEDDGNQDTSSEDQIYVGNDEIAQFFFHSSADNNSLILENVNDCLDSFQLLTCLKMLLLDRINNVVHLLQDPRVTNADLYFLNGLLVFERKNNTESSIPSEKSEGLSLDEEISGKVMTIFRNRSLRLNLFSKVKIEIEPVAGNKNGDFVCFSYRIQKEPKSSDGDEENLEQGRKKRKGGGMSMMMILPQLVMLGLMPFTLASLKAMVMNAVMINMMALNATIFMTIRNLVFGPRAGDNVQYVNYGYSKNRKTPSRKPVLIIHSPAAFVKQPEVYRKKNHRIRVVQSSSYGAQSGGHTHHNQNYGYSENNFVQENEIDSYSNEYRGTRRGDSQRRNYKPKQTFNDKQQVFQINNVKNNFGYSNDGGVSYQRNS